MVVHSDGGCVLADTEGRLTLLNNVEGFSNQNPGRLILELTAELITLILKSVVVTWLGVGCIGGVLLLQDVDVDWVEVCTQPAGGGTGHQHHACLKKQLNME